MAHDFHFITRWRVKGTADEVFEILSTPLDYPRWWPSVYLIVRELAAADHDANAPRHALTTAGWLPYRLRWQAVTSEARRPNSLAVHATGDFEGRGIWSIIQDEAGIFTDITFDWKLTARNAVLRYLSPVFRPAFEANHRWAMQQGQKSLELELARYRSTTMEEMNSIAPPAGPKQLWGRALTAGAVLAAGLIAGFLTKPPEAPAAASDPTTSPSQRTSRS